MTTKLIYGKYMANLINFNTKLFIIKYIHSKLENLYKFSFKILNNISTLTYLQINKHFVSYNYKGYNYLLIFTIINNEKYILAVDRKKILFNQSQIDINNLNIYKLEGIDIPEVIYDGTIFDGKLIENSIFLIHDCYYLMGKNILNINLDDKLNQINDILNNQLKNKILNFEFKINKLYTYDDLKNLISNINNSKLQTNGLIFFPIISGKNILFIENNQNIKKNDNTTSIDKHEIIKNNSNINNNITNINNLIFNYTNYLKTKKYYYENNLNTKELFLSKTDIPDVYDIYDNDIKLGIALIPNLKISHMCNTLIKKDELKKEDIPIFH